MPFYGNNHSVIKTHGFVRQIMTTIAYYWLKFKVYLEKIPVMTNNTIQRSISFISIYAFWVIKSIILWYLYPTRLNCTSIVKFVSETSHHLKWIRCCYIFIIIIWVRSLIFCHTSSYFFSVSLLSSVWTSVK